MQATPTCLSHNRPLPCQLCSERVPPNGVGSGVFDFSLSTEEVSVEKTETCRVCGKAVDKSTGETATCTSHRCKNRRPYLTHLACRSQLLCDKCQQSGSLACCLVCQLPVALGDEEADTGSPRVCGHFPSNTSTPLHSWCKAKVLQATCFGCAPMRLEITELDMTKTTKGTCPSCHLESSVRKLSSTSGFIDAHNIIAQENLRLLGGSGIVFTLKPFLWMHEVYACAMKNAQSNKLPICTLSRSLDLVVDDFNLDVILEQGNDLSFSSGQLLPALYDLSRVTWKSVTRQTFVDVKESNLANLLTTDVVGEKGLMGSSFCQSTEGFKQCHLCEMIQGDYPLLRRWRMVKYAPKLLDPKKQARAKVCSSTERLLKFVDWSDIEFIGAQFCRDEDNEPTTRIEDISVYYPLSCTVWQIERHLAFYRMKLEQAIFKQQNPPHFYMTMLRLWPMFSAYYCLKMIEECWSLD